MYGPSGARRNQKCSVSPDRSGRVQPGDARAQQAADRGRRGGRSEKSAAIEWLWVNEVHAISSDADKGLQANKAVAGFPNPSSVA